MSHWVENCEDRLRLNLESCHIEDGLRVVECLRNEVISLEETETSGRMQELFSLSVELCKKLCRSFAINFAKGWQLNKNFAKNFARALQKTLQEPCKKLSNLFQNFSLLPPLLCTQLNWEKSWISQNYSKESTVEWGKLTATFLLKVDFTAYH